MFNMNPIHWRRALFIAILTLLLIAAAVAYRLWTRCPIRYDNFDQIANGMHLSEVEKLLGCPPGDYRPGEMELAIIDVEFPIENEETRWQGDQGDLMIFHDHNKIVVGKAWIKGEPEPWVKTGMIWLVERIRK
jgi:hypothetical protein